MTVLTSQVSFSQSDILKALPVGWRSKGVTTARQDQRLVLRRDSTARQGTREATYLGGITWDIPYCALPGGVPGVYPALPPPWVYPAFPPPWVYPTLPGPSGVNPPRIKLSELHFLDVSHFLTFRNVTHFHRLFVRTAETVKTPTQAGLRVMCMTLFSPLRSEVSSFSTFRQRNKRHFCTTFTPFCRIRP